MQVKKQWLEPALYRTTGWFRIGKGHDKGVHCHPVSLTICRAHHAQCLAGWVTSWNQDCWRKYQQPQICGWYHSNGRKWRGTKDLLDEGKEESEKASLKLNIKKKFFLSKIMASGPITSWQIEEEKVKVVTDFFFLGSKITADGDCSREIRRWLLMTQSKNGPKTKQTFLQRRHTDG